MQESAQTHDTAERAMRALGIVAWAAIPASFVVKAILRPHSQAVVQDVVVGGMSVFFVALMIRLAICVAVRRRQRLALVPLLLAIVLWAAGAALLNAGSEPDLTHFPAPGEPLFLASYVAMAAFLIFGAGRDLRVPLDTWLHVLVICGGTVSLTGSLVLTPVGTAYSGDATGLFLALLYPLIDLVLAALVIGQVLLRLRDDLANSAALVAAFVLFAFADAHFVTDLSSGTYQLSELSDACWGIGFALIVGVACRPRTASPRVIPRMQGTAGTLVAAAVAVALLPLAPSDGIGLYLTIPAILTLLGAGGRLVLALREARGAAEALALSRTDDLTRLPNRRALRADLDAAYEAGRHVSLMLLDMDGFKEVNDTLGHTAGDEVLQLTAYRIRQSLPPTIGVARLGGDEFAVLVHDADVLELMEIAQDVLAHVREPVRVEGIEIKPSGSVGIAACGESVVKGSELLRRADVAMYQAKQQRLGVAVYDPADDDFSKAKLMFADELRKALDLNQFELWYQPQVSARTMQLCGFEALLRWRHPARGVLSPVEFLPAARQAGLMAAISTCVAELAVRDLATLRACGVDVRTAINCAPPELLGGAFTQDLYSRLDSFGLPADRMVIEVTEDSFIADPERARQVLQDVRDHGLEVAIDDYGTGFSSLAYLRDLAVDELKIDRSFVAAMGNDPRTRMIVASTVQMAHALSLRTVAEGVEDADCAADLALLGIDVLQGYYIARPMPASAVPAWATEWRLRGGTPAVDAVPELTTAAFDPTPRTKRSLKALARGSARGSAS
ncbi:MAG TPA: EAL domain-containing protein [Jatrophihabitans sp.]|jgi:diguanylate cyclase (GGDEF)-like protein|nr:EAL domain-containing protein [Jatrophihabitans sp.]